MLQAAAKATRGVRLAGVVVLAALAAGLASLCLFVVDAGEFAVVTQFGNPVRVETTPGLKLKYPAPVQSVTRFDRRQFVQIALRDYGIEVVDVRLRRLDFLPQNRASVFARMKSERVRISMRYRSEGEEEGLKIRAAAEKAKSGILAEAYKLSQKARGEGEARAAKIYAESLARAPGFYRFVRSIDAVKKAVDKDTTLVLPVDSDLFRLLRDSRFRFPEE